MRRQVRAYPTVIIGFLIQFYSLAGTRCFEFGKAPIVTPPHSKVNALQSCKNKGGEKRAQGVHKACTAQIEDVLRKN